MLVSLSWLCVVQDVSDPRYHMSTVFNSLVCLTLYTNPIRRWADLLQIRIIYHVRVFIIYLPRLIFMFEKCWQFLRVAKRKNNTHIVTHNYIRSQLPNMPSLGKPPRNIYRWRAMSPLFGMSGFRLHNFPAPEKGVSEQAWLIKIPLCLLPVINTTPKIGWRHT